MPMPPPPASRRSLARRSLARGALHGAILLGVPALPGRARAWAPARPVIVTVPYAAGGSADTVVRSLAERLVPLLGVPVVVENRPGAQTIIGAEAVARAEPDGHRLLLTTGATLILNPLSGRPLPYRVEDFAPVALLSTLAYALVAREGLPRTPADFVAHARAAPGRVSLGHLGRGSGLHLAGALMAARLGIAWTEVVYRGDALAVSDLVSGTLDAAMLGGPAAVAAQRGGRARIVAWTGPARLPARPEEPVLAETWPDLVAVGWLGIHAPARTPPEALARLNAAFAEALGGAEALRERLAGEAMLLSRGESAARFGAFVAEETRRWAPVLRGLGLG